MRYFIVFSLFMLSCGPARNTNPCNMDVARIEKSKMSDHPDAVAFHLKVYVYENDGTPAEGRTVRLYLNEKLVSRYKTEDGYASMQTLSAGITPQWTLKENAFFDLDILSSEEIGIYVAPFNEIKIKTKKGKTQTLSIYLGDVTWNDCTEYMRSKE